ncbi:MAG: hypothetical protein R2706_14510 [Acidimicrobiales bacterium]
MAALTCRFSGFGTALVTFMTKRKRHAITIILWRQQQSGLARVFKEPTMKKVFAGIIAGMTGLAVSAVWSGSISISWPWKVIPDFTDVEVAITIPNEVRIVEIEPITLDCRARVHAEVPLEGTASTSCSAGLSNRTPSQCRQ